MTGYLTWIFCAVIFLVFVYFFFQAIKLVRGYKLINKKLKEEDVLESLANTKLSYLKDAYQKSIIIKTENGTKSNTPASEFFSERSVTEALNVNEKMLEVSSGTLVGLGLLGTFLGLTMGINGFESSDSQHIQSSIQTLLDGMGTAFLTSLLGMLLSIVYTMFEKPWRNRLAKSVVALDDKIDAEYFIDDMTLLDLRQETLMKTMTETLSASISQQSENTSAELKQQTEKIETALRGLLMYTTDDGKSVIIANAIREILRENEQQSKALKSFSTDLALQLNEGFDEVLSRQMQQRILPLMESVDATTKSVIEHIDQMAMSVASPATDMIQTVVADLKSSMQEILTEFKTSLSSSAKNELEQLAASLGNATRAMGDFPKNMENISNTLQVTIEEVKNAITEISNTSASTNTSAMKQMQEQITFATTSISNAIMEVKEVMSALTHSSQENVDDLMSKMSGASDRMGEFMTQMMERVSASVKDSMSSITDEMVEKQMGLMSLQEEMIKDIKASMQTMTASSQESATGVINTLNQAQSTMGNFMQKTMEQLAMSVQGSMDSIYSDVSVMQSSIVELQNSTLKETTRLIESFNHGLDRLERMNEYIVGTMDMFQKAQGEITGSTTNLRTITGDMKIATEVFHKGQGEYAQSMINLQKLSQSNIDSVTELLRNSGEMSEDYVAKFETIKAGLSAIFTQIQAGLNEYSRTVQSSLQSFLGDYASSLTRTTDALSNSIQSQSDVANMLLEAVDTMNKRR